MGSRFRRCYQIVQDELAEQGLSVILPLAALHLALVFQE